jgi:putative spermidine/putrescine transport system permease protein
VVTAGRGLMGALLRVYVVAFLLFLAAPLVVVAGVSFEHQALLRFPPGGVSLRWYREVLASEQFVDAAWNSLAVAVLAMVGAVVLGTPAAYAVVRYRFPGREALAGLLLSPLVVPQLVIGIALLQFFAVLGVAASITTLTLGHILIALPYVVRTLSANIVGLDPAVEEAAATLGASRLQVYRLIVLPLVRSGLYAAMVFAFLISFDNAVVSLFLVSARTTTLPIAIYTYVEHSLDPSIAALSTLIMALSLLLMVALRWLGGVDRIDT